MFQLFNFIAHFQSRPPGIYKQQYIKELFHRYGNVEDTPRAPELPEWCFEEEEGVSDDDGESNNFGGGGDRPAKKMKRRPYNEVCLHFS